MINANYKVINDKPIILEFNTRIAGNIFSMTTFELKEFINCYIEYCNKLVI